MFKNIIVAVDNSPMARVMMQKAIELAADQNATLHILYVADESIVISNEILFDFAGYEKAIREEGQAILKNMAMLAKESKVVFKTHLIEITDSSKRIAGVINSAAESLHADLIMIGTHGRRGIPRLFLGSVAEEVLRSSMIPVMLIREK